VIPVCVRRKEVKERERWRRGVIAVFSGGVVGMKQTVSCRDIYLFMYLFAQ